MSRIIINNYKIIKNSHEYSMVSINNYFTRHYLTCREVHSGFYTETMLIEKDNKSYYYIHIISHTGKIVRDNLVLEKNV